MLSAILGLGPTEILIIVLFIILLIIGPKKLPQLFRSLGQSVGELKKGMRESENELNKPKKAKKKKSSAK